MYSVTPTRVNARVDVADDSSHACGYPFYFISPLNVLSWLIEKQNFFETLQNYVLFYVEFNIFHAIAFRFDFRKKI